MRNLIAVTLVGSLLAGCGMDSTGTLPEMPVPGASVTRIHDGDGVTVFEVDGVRCIGLVYRDGGGLSCDWVGAQPERICHTDYECEVLP